MYAVDVIAKKRDGQALSSEEIRWFVEAYTDDTIPDYQAAALLMAIYLQGMSRQETVDLTIAMAESGKMMDLTDLAPYAVDKHSSGGVGDKTSLVVLPMVAACGVTVAKMSGRGLGFSGGTLDKLESIPGYRVDLKETEFRRLAAENGIVLSGQTRELAPADGKLYALRDVTATVSSLPLIAASIMSKKLAAGANGIVLDVKWGRGAFMQSLDRARELARTMVQIGEDAGRDMVAVLSDMNQPLGRTVGNALEVREAVEALRGEGPDDLREHCKVIAAHMLRLAGRGEKWTYLDENREILADKLSSGAAAAMFRRMVEAQGGDVRVIDDPARLTQARSRETCKAEHAGYIAEVAADEIARAALVLGAGRQKKGDPIDHAVGVEVLVQVGDVVEQGKPLAIIHANDPDRLAAALAHVRQAVKYSSEPVEPLPLFYGTITGQDLA